MRQILMFLGSFSLWSSPIFAQTLMTVGKESISKQEFLAGYAKNVNSNQLSYDAAALKSYIDLYALYKMKLMEAEAVHLDTIPSLKTEITGYKQQLAKNYLMDKEALSKMTKEAYGRMQKERRVAHILMQVPNHNSDGATVRSMDSIYQLIHSGKVKFEDMAVHYSIDRATAVRGGDLGYIKALQTPYEFENAVYSTAVGSVSKPFKSPMGMHLVKVLDERPGVGQVEVAQILLPVTNGNEAQIAAQKAKAMEIRNKISSGAATFSEMVKQYSQDPYSVGNEGKLAPFETGQMVPQFEEAAFALRNVGDLSQPIVTEYGVHLIQLIGRTPLGSYESMEPQLIRQIENSPRYDVLKQNAMAQNKKQLGFKEYPAALKKLIATVMNSDLAGKNLASAFPSLKENLFELGGRSYTQQQFLAYVQDLTRGSFVGNKEETFAELYKMYVDKSVSDAQIVLLEKSNPAYANLANEYRNSALLFYLMDQKIWSKSSTDTLALKDFYLKNKAKYQWQPGFSGTIFQSKNPTALRQVHDALSAGKTVEEALALMNTPENMEKVVYQIGRFEYSYAPAIDKNALVVQRPSKIALQSDGLEVFAFPTNIYATKGNKTLEEARGAVIDDYQKYLEAEWHAELKRKYPVKVNNEVFQSLIR